MTEKIRLQDLLDPKAFKQYETKFAEYFQKGGTWKLLFEVDDQQMEAQYKLAYDYYQEEKYQESSDLFTYLSILDPYNYDYWMGLAASRQGLQKFEEAVLHYTTAGAISPEEPLPHLQLSSCLFAMREVDMAKEELRIAKELAGAKPEYAEILRNATYLEQNFPKLR